MLLRRNPDWPPQHEPLRGSLPNIRHARPHDNPRRCRVTDWISAYKTLTPEEWPWAREFGDPGATIYGPLSSMIVFVIHR